MLGVQKMSSFKPVAPGRKRDDFMKSKLERVSESRTSPSSPITNRNMKNGFQPIDSVGGRLANRSPGLSVNTLTGETSPLPHPPLSGGKSPYNRMHRTSSERSLTALEHSNLGKGRRSMDEIVDASKHMRTPPKQTKSQSNNTLPSPCPSPLANERTSPASTSSQQSARIESSSISPVTVPSGRSRPPSSNMPGAPLGFNKTPVSNSRGSVEKHSTSSGNKTPTPLKRKDWKLEMFELGRKLGAGKYGTVYQANLKGHPGITVALKQLNLDEINKSKSMKLHVLREIDIHRRISHANIVRLYGYFESGNHLYMILEYACRGELFQLVKRRQRVPEETVSRYIRQICDALSYLHSMGIIHRDLKPENILRDKDDNIKIADFGWAVDTSSSRPKTSCGTLDYLAPEMVNKQEHSFGIDVWCVGVLAYELCTGSPPFEGKEKKEVHQKILNVSLTYPSHMSSLVKDFIQSILVVDQRKRPPLEHVLKHPFLVFH